MLKDPRCYVFIAIYSLNKAGLEKVPVWVKDLYQEFMTETRIKGDNLKPEQFDCASCP